LVPFRRNADANTFNNSHAHAYCDSNNNPYSDSDGHGHAYRCSEGYAAAAADTASTPHSVGRMLIREQ